MAAAKATKSASENSDDKISASNGPPTRRLPIPPTRRLPIQETQQPDPLMRLSVGRLGAGGISLAALVIAAIIGIVFYGLNQASVTAPASAPSSSAPSLGTGGGAHAGIDSAAKPSAPRTNESGLKG